jgi:hypothetical protein
MTLLEAIILTVITASTLPVAVTNERTSVRSRVEIFQVQD